MLPSTILFELEEAFNFPHFLNIPVGVTLNDTLIVNFLNGKRVWNFRARMSDCFRIRYHRFYQSFSGVKKFGGYKGRMVFTWLFDRQDLKNLVFPIVSNYANSDSLVVGSFSSMREKVPKQTEFISWADFPKIDMKAWRVEFDRCEPIWRQRLIDVLERHSIPECIVDFLITNLQVQTQNIMSAIRFIDEVQPTVIVTEYDRNTHSSCLILAAKKKGVPVITMIHGAAIIPPPRYGYVPVLADYVCCWGDRHKENFIEHGASSEQLVITGCQGLTRGMATSKASGFSSAMLPVGKTAVLLATSPIELEERIAYASVFCDAMSKIPEISVIIKLHPAETVVEYQKLVNLYPNVFFMSNTDMPRDVALSVADVVVGVRSRKQRLAEHIFAFYSSLRFGIKDPLCGMKAYRATVYSMLGHFDSCDSVGTELMIFSAKHKFKIDQVPFDVSERDGASRFGQIFLGNYKIIRAMVMTAVLVK